ncbi:hypothetical protein WK07_06240 [Burkholderia multivorans]|nr:hypothetical protein WK07_06240 [Burkholderia multivorans]
MRYARFARRILFFSFDFSALVDRCMCVAACPVSIALVRYAGIERVTGCIAALAAIRGSHLRCSAKSNAIHRNI